MIETFDQWGDVFVGNGVFASARPVADHTDALTSAEADIVATSVAKRKNTYSTGRYCARESLQALGLAQEAFSDGLLQRPDGAVDWPVGVVGSISHANDWAIAAVSSSSGAYASIGIDIELIDRVSRDVLRLIATEHERDEIDANEHLRWLRVALFSIKESVYKCLRPLYGEFINFKDVQLMNLTTPMPIEDEKRMDGIEFYNPSIKLLLPKLSACCDESRLSIRLAVLPKHVVSLVFYHS